MVMMDYQFVWFKWVSKPFSIIFWNCLKAGYFPAAWKEISVVPVQKKKRNKQVLNNYRPVSLLRICSKLFEKIIFDTILQHLMLNKLLNPNQSVFMPGDSSFDSNLSLEIRGISLHISKAFDQVWHERLYIYICLGVNGDVLTLIF